VSALNPPHRSRRGRMDGPAAPTLSNGAAQHDLQRWQAAAEGGGHKQGRAVPSHQVSVTCFRALPCLKPLGRFSGLCLRRFCKLTWQSSQSCDCCISRKRTHPVRHVSKWHSSRRLCCALMCSI
jgi:hypothetical protein